MERAVELARSSDPWTRAAVMFYTFGAAIACGVYAVDDAACREIDDALRMAEAAGDDLGSEHSPSTRRGWCWFTGTPRTVTVGLSC